MEDELIREYIYKIRKRKIAEKGRDLCMEIINSFKNRINYLSYSYHVPDMDKDDLKQELMMSVLDAIKPPKNKKGFNLKNKNKFSTYINKVMMMKIYWLTKRSFKDKRKMNSLSHFDLDEIENARNQSKKSFVNLLGCRNITADSETERLDNITNKIFMQNILVFLKPKLKAWEWRTIEMLLENYSYDEILKRLHKEKYTDKKLSPTRITHLLKRKCRRLVKHLSVG